MTLGETYDPADYWPPWIGHWFPSVGPPEMAGLTFAQIIAMYEFASSGEGE